MDKLRRGLASVVLALATLTATVAPAAAVVPHDDDPSIQIIGGRDATEVYPWMGAEFVLYPGVGTALCSAELWLDRYVVTAAHCVSDMFAAPTPVPVPAERITLRIGSLDRASGGVVATGKRVILHPNWKWGTNAPAEPVSDVAMVELDRRVTLQRGLVLPAHTGNVRILGWGLTQFPPPPGTSPPRILQELDTEVLPAEDCAFGFIGAGEICVGGADGTSGACFGDSGGPAIQRIGDSGWNRWKIVGVASREGSEAGCGKAVYTDLGYFLGWMIRAVFQPVGPPTDPPVVTGNMSPQVRWK